MLVIIITHFVEITTQVVERELRMIKIYQTAEGLCVTEQDLGKLLDVTNGTIYNYIFCGYNAYNLPNEVRETFRESSYWDISFVTKGLKRKLQNPTSLAKLSHYKKARIEYLVDYLTMFIRGAEPQATNPICING